MIGRSMGTLHEETLGRKFVVANSYLRFKVDLFVESPIPAGFFQEQPDGDENWIQFKFERLSDFCYKSGMLNHMTGKCPFEKPMTIITANRISTRLYGHWLKAGHVGSLLVVKLEEEENDRSRKLLHSMVNR